MIDYVMDSNIMTSPCTFDDAIVRARCLGQPPLPCIGCGVLANYQDKHNLKHIAFSGFPAVFVHQIMKDTPKNSADKIFYAKTRDL